MMQTLRLAYHSAGTFGAGTQHRQRHLVLPGQRNTAGVQHFRAAFGHCQHLIVGDEIVAAAMGKFTGILLIDAIHIGADAAAAGIKRGGQSSGSGIAAAATQGSKVPHAIDALETGYNNDLAAFQLPQNTAAVQGRDLGCRVVAIGVQPGLPAGKGNGEKSFFLQRHGQQGGGSLLAGGKELIGFPAGRMGCQLRGAFQQTIGGFSLCGDHRNNMVTGCSGRSQLAGSALQSGGIGDRGAAEFIDKEIHRVAPFRVR